MSTPPVDINGILRIDTKQTDLTAGQYNGNARPGELVVDLTTYDLFIGNLEGYLNPFQNPESFKPSFLSNGSSNARIYTANGDITFSVGGTPNVAVIGPDTITIDGHLIPAANATYSLGNATHQWKNVWLSGSSLYMNGMVISSIGGVLSLNGQPIVTATGAIVNTTTLNASNTITAAGNLVVTDDMIVSDAIISNGTISTNLELVSTGDIFATDLISGGNVSVLDDIGAGNVNLVGNITAVDMAASGSMTASQQIIADTGMIGDTISSRTGSLTLYSIAPDQNIILDPVGTGAIDVSGTNITNILDPVQPQDLASKAYVDSVGIVGYQPKDTIQVATTASLATLGAGTVTYDNGTAGVGATLTLSAGIVTLDGIPLTVGDRILVKDEVDQSTNGVYEYTSTTVLTRATDSDTPGDLAVGSYYYVRTGATLGKDAFVIRSVVTNVGLDPVVFMQVTGVATISAGTDLVVIADKLAMANTGVTAGTYGNSARGLQITVTGTGLTTAVANTMVEGPVANWTVTFRQTTANLSVLSGITGTGNITTVGNISGANLYTTRNGAFGTTSNISGVLAVGGNATISTKLSASRINTTLPQGIYNVRNMNVTNLWNQEFEGEYRGATTFNNITSMGLVDNLTIPGGVAGATYTTNGGTSGGYWNAVNDVTINQAIKNYDSLLIGGNLSARYALGGSSTSTFGTVTTPTGWIVCRPTTGLATLGNARVISPDDGVRLVSQENQRGSVYAKPGWSKSDFLRRDYPLLLEASFNTSTFNTDWVNKTTGGIWIVLGACEQDINNYEKAGGFYYPSLGKYNSQPDSGAVFYISATNANNIDAPFINSPDYCGMQFAQTQTSVLSPSVTKAGIWWPQWAYTGSDAKGWDIVPAPLGVQLKISKSKLMNGGHIKMGMLYVWPSGANSKRYIHMYFNDTLVLTHSWLPDGRDWIDQWGDSELYGETYDYDIPRYIIAGAGTSGNFIGQTVINLTSMTFQSGQALYYRDFNSLSTMNMQS